MNSPLESQDPQQKLQEEGEEVDVKEFEMTGVLDQSNFYDQTSRLAPDHITRRAADVMYDIHPEEPPEEPNKSEEEK